MFRSDAHANRSRGQSGKPRDPEDCLKLPRRLRRTGILKYPLKQTVCKDLHLLGHDRRELSSPLNQCQSRFGDPSFAKRISQQVSCGHRVLNREIDSYSASRRHGVCRVAYAQQSGPIPLSQTVNLDRQQLDLLPIFQFLNPIAEVRRDAQNDLAKQLQSVAFHFFERTFTNQQPGLKVVAPINEY